MSHFQDLFPVKPSLIRADILQTSTKTINSAQTYFIYKNNKTFVRYLQKLQTFVGKYKYNNATR